MEDTDTDVAGRAPSRVPPSPPLPPPPPPRPAAATQLAKGVFEWEPGKTGDDFNLRPIDARLTPIPDDQRKISGEVYEVRNILKLLKEQKIFRNDTVAYDEFVTRTVEAGNVGCVSTAVDTSLASAALEQIRADILRRKGRHLTYSYLTFLGICALVGVAIGSLIIYVSQVIPSLLGYGWVIIGAMVGGWLSVAAGRREVSFDSIPDYLNYGYEPPIRMLFVAVLALVFALFLQLKILDITIAGFHLSNFSKAISDAIGWALAIGVIAGIGERTLSVKLIARAQDVISPGKR